MENVEEAHAASRRPAGLDVAAALALVATVVLHVVAMAPTYFTASGSLMSQADQATLYAIMAASWALALAIGLTGPHRTPVAAALAVGVAVTEMGFRAADLGDVFRYGSASVGSGFWLMEAAWLVGAAGALLAVLAARARHRSRTTPGASEPERVDLSELALGVDWAAPVAAGEESPAVAMDDPTRAQRRSGDTSVLPVAAVTASEDAHERLAWTLLVVILAALTAGAFLPAWDHAQATSTITGRSVSLDLGNAFSHQPWQQVIGTVLAALSMLAVPVVAVRWRNKAVGAAATCGMLLVLGAQLASAVVQVDQPVPASDFGINSAQVQQLGLALSLKLTGWFTLDALAAYALFAAVMVWATLRLAHESSSGTAQSAPDLRSPAMPSAS
ncbi:MAG: hypothetical protein M0Z30_08890 [Actinomycetota bacterium]|nr:hypothetical protein [Actinomycetota bacterium]